MFRVQIFDVTENLKFFWKIKNTLLGHVGSLTSTKRHLRSREIDGKAARVYLTAAVAAPTSIIVGHPSSPLW
jgi:hypothetical protein